MKAYHNSVVLRNDGEDPSTFKLDLNAGITQLVTVRINSTQALASIFDLDEVGTANPLTTDSNGNYAFKANDDIYDIIVAEGTANEVKLEKVEVAEIPIPSDLISDLSQAYEFDTVALMKSSLIVFPDNKPLSTKGRVTVIDGEGATYIKQPSGDGETLAGGGVAVYQSLNKVPETTTLQLLNLPAEMLVQTQGYTVADDGGGYSYYTKTSTQAATDGNTIDGVVDFSLANGNAAIRKEMIPYTRGARITEFLPSFKMPFSFSTNSQKGDLIGDLCGYFPDGWDIPELSIAPVNYLTFLATSWNAASAPIYRYTIASWEGEGYLPDEYVLGGSLTDNKTGKKYNPVNVSSGSFADGDFRIYITNSGDFEVLFRNDAGVPVVADIEIQIPMGNAGLSNDAAYVDKSNGDDTNSGYSWESPKATTPSALALGKKKVWVRGGTSIADRVYLIGETMGTYSAAVDVTIEGVGGVIFTSSPAPVEAWSSTGAPETWTSAPPNSSTYVGMWASDYKDEFGDPLMLTQQDSIANVTANEGSWYQASGGSAIYVHIPGSGQPLDNSVYPMQSSPIRTEADATVMIKNIDFIGGSGGAYSGRDSTEASRSVVMGCGFFGNHSADGYQIKDIGTSIAIDCRAGQNFNDGFNYHARNGITPHSIEVNCTGLSAQTSATGNGSTLHEDCQIVRIDCQYNFNNGKAIADVGESSSVNVNLTTSNSGYINSDVNSDGYSFSGTGEFWLMNSHTSNNAGVPVRVYDSATLHLLGDTIKRQDVTLEDTAVLSLKES